MAIPGNTLSSTTESIDPNTSGWTPKLNCTVGLGSGGRNGDGVLAVTSKAAGEMQVRTVSSYPVTAGTVYHTFADTSGSVPERIGIRWLTAAGAEISVTWSLTTSAASASWHRVSVAGAAPVNAVRAQVLLSSTPAAAGVTHYWENVYLGLPQRTTSNLLGFNTETTEIDASAWTPAVNATISRQAPPVSWSATAYTVGGHVTAITATAAGAASAVTVERSVVTPGTDYLAYTYLSPPTASSDTWIELRFYDAGGAQIAASRSSLVVTAIGWYRQRASAIAPAGAATCAVAAGIEGASAGQVLRLEQTAVIVAPTARAGTVVPYRNASFEQDAGGWTVTSGAATAARSTPWGLYGVDGSYVLTVTSATATASTLRSPLFPLTPGVGLNWRSEIYSQVTAGGWTAVRGIRWYDAGGTSLGLSSVASSAVPASGWWILTNDWVAPANAAQAAIEWTLTATGASSVLRLDVASLWPALPLQHVDVDDAAAAITLTLRELPIGYLITVYRTGQDGSQTLVRGPSGLLDKTAITSDLMVIEDYEAPLGVPVAYRIEIVPAAGGSIQIRTTETATIDPGDPQEAWLKDPGQPQRNTRVLVERAPDWSRPIEQATYRVKGRRNAVILSGLRGGLEGDLSIWTRTDDERSRLHWLLDSGNTLFWQAAPGMGVADMYVTVGEVTEGRIGGPAQEPWRTWKLPLVEADMPVSVGVGGTAGRTWQDVLTTFATWADVLNAYATGEDLLFDRRRG